MTENRELEFTCPICQKTKSINVPEAVLSQKKFGTIKIQVPAGAVCSEHQFIAFVDTKGIVRGYEKIDVSMSTQKESKEGKVDEINLNKLISRYGMYGVFCLLHVTLFDYPSYIITNQQNSIDLDDINQFFFSLLPKEYQNSNKIENLVFDADIYKAEHWYFEKVKLKEKDAFLMDTKQYILQEPWDEDLKFEEKIVKKALEILDPDEQKLLIEQDITSFVNTCIQTKQILENVKEIYENDLIDKLKKEYNFQKVDKDYISRVKIFLERRHSPKLAKQIKNKVQEFLDFL